MNEILFILNHGAEPITERTILTNKILTNFLYKTTIDGLSNIEINQIKMWIIPQKTENDDSYEINSGYYESMINQVLDELTNAGYLHSNFGDGIEDNDEKLFSLTKVGLDYASRIDNKNNYSEV